MIIVTEKWKSAISKKWLQWNYENINSYDYNHLQMNQILALNDP